MFGNFEFADRVAIQFAMIDKRCREDLRKKRIPNERDYVSRLTTRLSDFYYDNNLLSVEAQTSLGSIEQKLGVDGIIIFRIGNQIKIGIFEAKWPRTLKKNYPWDKCTEDGFSHFSSQIIRQRKWHTDLAIWEMFFNEANNGFESPPFDAFGSSCVWNNNAYDFAHSEKLIFKKWETQNLKKLLKSSRQNFYTIIYDIISCSAGRIYNVKANDSTLSLTSRTDDSSTLNVPIPTENMKNEQITDRVQSFLLDNNLNNYLFVNLSK